MRRKMWTVYSRAIEDAVGRHLSDDHADKLSALLERLVANPR